MSPSERMQPYPQLTSPCAAVAFTDAPFPAPVALSKFCETGKMAGAGRRRMSSDIPGPSHLFHCPACPRSCARCSSPAKQCQSQSSRILASNAHLFEHTIFLACLRRVAPRLRIPSAARIAFHSAYSPLHRQTVLARSALAAGPATVPRQHP